jgi:hypothetical protein
LNSGSNFYYHIDGDAKGIMRQTEINMLHKQLNIVVSESK